ncbi:MAG: hypothetical protein Q7T03_05545 [Deltaproteobacteria bacterium]|nr:hypothetical protein [Deltaproteobacteria bacterium]
MSLCAFCQKEVSLSGTVGRRDVCPHCDADLHCCFQCHFYNPDVHHECTEPQADYVSEKEKANFCDYFRFDPHAKVKVADKEAQKAKLDALFKIKK